MKKKILLTISVLATMTMAPQAWAHHFIEFAGPYDAATGFLSGLGHLVIGWDHAFFVIAFSLVCWRQAWRFYALSLLIFAVAAGTYLAHKFNFDVTVTPAMSAGLNYQVETLYLFALLLFVVLLFALPRLKPTFWGALIVFFYTPIAGALTGVLLSEGIIGAGPAPLYAYLTGLSLAHAGIVFLCWGIWQILLHPRTRGDLISGHMLNREAVIARTMALVMVGVVFSSLVV